MGSKTVQNSSFRGFLVRPRVLLLTLLRQNQGLSPQIFVANFVATKPRFVVIEFCC